MALVTSKKLLKDAQKGGYAIAAFNVENMEMVMAVIEAAREENCPILIQTTPSTVKYGSAPLYGAIVKELAQNIDVPIAMHLDHGESYEAAISAMMSGYTSIMIDGSQLSFEDNIALTKKVVGAAHAVGIPVEAELGKVGGKEDDLDVGQTDDKTDPREAAEFVERTGADFLAVAIGTAHGLYKGTPNIDVERLKEIRKLVDIPLVLHGATGVDDEVVKQCIKTGISKVNYATELRIAYTDGIKEVVQKDSSIFDPKVLGRAGMAKVKAVAIKNIRTCLLK